MPNNIPQNSPNNKKQRSSNKGGLLITIFLIFFLIVISIISTQVIDNLFRPNNESPVGEYSFVVESGDNFESIAQILSDDKVIKTPLSLRYHVWTSDPEPLQTGEYKINVPSSPEEILNQINTISIQKRQQNINASNAPQITITFKEGLTLDQYIDLMEEKGLINREEFVEYSKNPNNFDRETYDFLPTPLDCNYGDTSSCAKYYPEGYLYPDTYSFFVPSTPNDIYSKFFNNFRTKTSTVPNLTTQQNLKEQVIIASMIERETGRPFGITESNRQDLIEERRQMASVFKNRLDLGMRLESDPTVTYGTGKTVCQSTFTVEGCVFLDDPIVSNNKYNTYSIMKLPIGPVTSPSISSIEAVFNPIENDYLYFVSDITGKKYFATTFREHQNNISMVQKLNQELSNR
jgi:UPF0755 protein